MAATSPHLAGVLDHREEAYGVLPSTLELHSQGLGADKTTSMQRLSAKKLIET